MNAAMRTQMIVGLAVVGAMLAIVGLSYGYYQDQRAAAQSEMQELSSCGNLAQKIEADRGVNAKPTAPAAASLDLPKAIADAAASAGLSNASIDGIHPDAIRKSAGGDLVEKPTRLSLHHVTLNQVLSLLVLLDRPSDGLRIEKLHLSAETGQSETNTWSAEALLIHSSATAAARAGAGAS